MIRDRAYYSKKQIRNLILQNNVQITEQARSTAQECFGWDIDDICSAILELPIKYCYKSETRFDNPQIWVDYYRAYDLKGENVYTHFYVDSNNLIIDSLKEE
ncbi:MAG: type II toxin-antitoxin system MqsR family toxin [Desulfamplus sp.]|nr:type II toxin-antitoxin system MqsR family toxin [Desulfamplus sp.]